MSTSTLLKINTAMIFQICPRGIVSLVKFMNRLVLVNVAIRCILGMYSDYLVSLLIKLVRLALSFIGIIVNGSKKYRVQTPPPERTNPAAAPLVLAALAATPPATKTVPVHLASISMAFTFLPCLTITRTPV